MKMAETYNITAAFDEANKSDGVFYILDPSWPGFGSRLPNIREFDVVASMIQACKTAKRLKPMDIMLDGQKVVGKTALNLEEYDLATMVNAMYTDPTKPLNVNHNLSGLGNDYGETKITDMEIANLVRNKEWFDRLVFIDSSDGPTKIISKQEAFEKYGIRYIGDIIK